MARTVAAGLLRPLAGALLSLAVAASTPLGAAWADPTFSTVYSFRGSSFNDHPGGALVADRRTGLFYGTNYGGGAGFGAVYQLARPSAPGGTWTETILYSFKGGSDGSFLVGDLTLGPAGELYGTTAQGGATGDGTVFVLTPPATPGGAWTHAVLHSFLAFDDGSYPQGGLVIGRAGALYGTTPYGGGGLGCISYGCGTAFELAPPVIAGGAWTATVLHRFEGGGDGAEPPAGLTAYGGDLYGVTAAGGANGACDCGVVFRLRPPAAPGRAWTKANIYTFHDSKIAGTPVAPLTAARSGVLYGTTLNGGTYPPFSGTVFRLTPPAVADGNWDFTVLHTFNAEQEGSPTAPNQLAFNSAGEIVGATGPYACGACGEVFKLTPPAQPDGTWAIQVLHQFFAQSSGLTTGRFLLSRATILGATYFDGAFRAGSVFEIRP